VSQIAALSVQTVHRPQAAPAAARVEPAETRAATPAPAAASERREPTPVAPAMAEETLGALIAAQAGGHGDPQPSHGRDDEHGHKPPAGDPPPVVTPPPVAQPPANPPPPKPPVSYDPAAPARAIAMIDRQLKDEAVSQAARAAFSAAAAQRHAAAYVAQGRAALAILQTTQADMAAFQGGWSARRPLAERILQA